MKKLYENPIDLQKQNFLILSNQRKIGSRLFLYSFFLKNIHTFIS
jgi:hypothetical protein